MQSSCEPPVGVGQVDAPTVAGARQAALKCSQGRRLPVPVAPPLPTIDAPSPAELPQFANRTRQPIAAAKVRKVDLFGAAISRITLATRATARTARKASTVPSGFAKPPSYPSRVGLQPRGVSGFRRGQDGPHAQPIIVGSGSNVIPNCACTASPTWWASSSSSAVEPPPRWTSASAWAVETPAAP